MLKTITPEKVRTSNAYTALAQRTATKGFQPATAIRELTAKAGEWFKTRTHVTEATYHNLVETAVFGDLLPDNKLKEVVGTFLDDVRKAQDSSVATSIRNSLRDTFARAFRKNARELRMEPECEQPDTVCKLPTTGVFCF